MTYDLTRRATAEFAGAAILAATVIGSGVMGANLADGNAALALLGNTLATAAMLFALIAALGPISGAHFNPAVTLSALLQRDMSVGAAALYLIMQVAGCVSGALLAHAMFDLPLIHAATTERAGAAQWLSEGVATFLLVSVIFLVSRFRPQSVGLAASLTIAAGYWWTASTSFANPAITIARSLSDTFAGIRPQDAPGFIVAQFVGAVLATSACSWLYRVRAAQAVSTAAAARSVSNSGG